jgi:hypothetical protein
MVVVHFTATEGSSIMRLTHVLKYMSKSHKAVILFTSVDVDIVKKGLYYLIKTNVVGGPTQGKLF